MSPLRPLSWKWEKKKRSMTYIFCTQWMDTKCKGSFSRLDCFKLYLSASQHTQMSSCPFRYCSIIKMLNKGYAPSTIVSFELPNPRSLPRSGYNYNSNIVIPHSVILSFSQFISFWYTWFTYYIFMYECNVTMYGKKDDNKKKDLMLIILNYIMKFI
jgi:hypothetical protein